MPMDQDEDPLLPPAKKEPEARDVRDVFDEQCAMIDDGIWMFGRIDGTGNRYRVELQSEEMATMLPDMQFILAASTGRYAAAAEQTLALSMVLPCPVHVSPIALALVRDQGCYRCTDAISCLKRMLILRDAILNIDTSVPQHKAKAKVVYKQLVTYVMANFYTELDAIVALGNVPAEEQTEDPGYHAALVHRFGVACERYALDFIHCIEWNIADMLKVPIAQRAMMMTPRMFPTARETKDWREFNAPGLTELTQMQLETKRYLGSRVWFTSKSMTGTNFSILRKNLSDYTRNRHFALVGKAADDAWRPMHLDGPLLEHRIMELAAPPADVSIPPGVMYGLYKGFISLHTLREFMLFLSTDTRPKPETTPVEMVSPFHMFGKEPEPIVNSRSVNNPEGTSGPRGASGSRVNMDMGDGE